MIKQHHIEHGMHNDPHPSTSTTSDSFARNLVDNLDEMASVKGDDPVLSTCIKPDPHSCDFYSTPMGSPLNSCGVSNNHTILTVSNVCNSLLYELFIDKNIF